MIPGELCSISSSIPLSLDPSEVVGLTIVHKIIPCQLSSILSFPFSYVFFSGVSVFGSHKAQNGGQVHNVIKDGELKSGGPESRRIKPCFCFYRFCMQDKCKTSNKARSPCLNAGGPAHQKTLILILHFCHCITQYGLCIFCFSLCRESQPQWESLTWDIFQPSDFGQIINFQNSSLLARIRAIMRFYSSYILFEEESFCS